MRYQQKAGKSRRKGACLSILVRRTASHDFDSDLCQLRELQIFLPSSLACLLSFLKMT